MADTTATIPPAKRQRFVFPPGEISHLWAHALETGRYSARSTGAGNFFFNRNSDNEPVLYSYGEHFAVARLTTSPVTGAKVALVNSCKYSATTGGHIRAAKSAIPPGVITFIVPFVEGNRRGRNYTTADSNIDYLAREVTRLRAEMNAARGNAATLAAQLERAIISHNEYRALFDPAAPVLDVTLESLQEEFASARARTIRADTLLEARRARQSAARRAENAARDLQDKKDFAAKLADWKAGNPLQSHCPPCQTVHLRLRGQAPVYTVQTSRGASFPLESARAAFNSIQIVRASGAEYFPGPGNTMRLGDYSIDSIDAAGNVRAGCHFVPYSSIEDFAARMGWIETPCAPAPA